MKTLYKNAVEEQQIQEAIEKLDIKLYNVQCKELEKGNFEYAKIDIVRLMLVELIRENLKLKKKFAEAV